MLIQPWELWETYSLNPWEADIVKRAMRNKGGLQGNIEDMKKIRHLINFLESFWERHPDAARRRETINDFNRQEYKAITEKQIKTTLTKLFPDKESVENRLSMIRQILFINPARGFQQLRYSMFAEKAFLARQQEREK